MLLSVNRKAFSVGTMNKGVGPAVIATGDWGLALSQSFTAIAGTIPNDARMWAMQVNNAGAVGIWVVFQSSSSAVAPSLVALPYGQGTLVLPGQTADIDLSALGGDSGIHRMLYASAITQTTSTDVAQLSSRVVFTGEFYTAGQS